MTTEQARELELFFIDNGKNIDEAREIIKKIKSVKDRRTEQAKTDDVFGAGGITNELLE
jgi:hypothetical protein